MSMVPGKCFEFMAALEDFPFLFLINLLAKTQERIEISKFSFFLTAFKAKKNNLVHIIPFIGREFTFEFNFTYFTTDKSVSYSSALLCTTATAWTERWPAVWVRPGGEVQVQMFYDIQESSISLLGEALVRQPNRKYNIHISSTFSAADGKYKFVYKVDGVVRRQLLKAENEVPEFQNVKCYISSPHHKPSYALIEDFKYKPEGQ